MAFRILVRIFALAAVACSAYTASPQNAEEDTTLIQDRYGFKINVPVNIEDAARHIKFSEISCQVSASLTADDNVVGTGSALILPDTNTPVDRQDVAEAYRMANRVTGGLYEGVNTDVDVPIMSVPPYELSGWTHGACQLLLHYSVSGGENTNAERPQDCTDTTSVDVALCSRPGSDLIATQRFGRKGFDETGQILERGN